MSRRTEVVDGKLTCSKCKRTLPVECFSKGKNASGYRSTCKECVHADYEAKKDAILKRHKEYYERTKDQYLEMCKRYREEHRGEKQQYFAEYYKAHSDVIKQKAREAYENIDEAGMEKRRQYYHKRRVTKRFRTARCEYEEKRKALAAAAVSDLTEEQWQENLGEFEGGCAYCGAHENISRDHIIPLSKGGGYTKKNIIPCCVSCNSKKHDKDYAEWYQAQPFFSADRLRKIEHIMEMG